jgi:inosine-uridine nucleoside N-ribohydrolase
MRHRSLRIASLCSLLSLNALAAAPKPVIFDTDMDSDVDDVAALAQLHVMADAGEVEILAVMLSGKNEYSGRCVDAINTYYNRPDIPIGLIARTDRSEKQDTKFANQVAAEFPWDFDSARCLFANELYRKLLAERPDNSVTIISVGDLTNLASLLDTGGDSYSPLKGPDLVKQKVAHYYCMGSRYPADKDQNPGKWGNFRTDPESTKEVVDSWPGMITFTGGGSFSELMQIGTRITQLDPLKNPVSLAYRSFFGEEFVGKKRHTADSLCVLIAVRGIEPYFKLVDTGYNEIDPMGRNIWHETPDVDNRQYVSALKNKADAPKLAELMEDLAMTPPKGTE